MSKTNKLDATIVDIAKALNLSLSTVSRALGDHPYVKYETRSKVHQMAEKLGYRRNVFASGLKNNRTFTIGMIVPRISMYFHSVVCTSVQNELFQQGYNLVICQSNDDLIMERNLVDTLFKTRMDGIIAACTLQTVSYEHFDVFSKQGVPLVFYDRVPPLTYPSLSICGDDVQGGYLATKHLIDTGCKRIAHISGPLSCNLYADRSAGYRKALEQHGITFDPDLLKCHDLTYANARKSLTQLFDQGQPEALFSANDTTAITAIEFAREQGIAVPKDLKIVGYSNDPRSAIISPSLTTIEQFPQQIGKLIVEKIMEMIKQKDSCQGRSIVPIELIRRMST